MKKEPSVGKPASLWSRVSRHRKPDVTDDNYRRNLDWYKRPPSVCNEFCDASELQSVGSNEMKSRVARSAALNMLYEFYVARFERRERYLGWIRFFLSRPLGAVAILLKSKPLPNQYRHTP